MGEVQVLLLVMVFGMSTFADIATLNDECTLGKIDIGFLVDSSKMVKKTFEKELEIVQEIVRAFNIRAGFNRAGLVSFSTHATLDMNMGEYPDVTSFNHQVSNLKHKGKNSYIDRGIDKVTDTLFFGSGTDRKILFVLSDGKQTEENNDVDLEVHVRNLKRAEVNIIAIAMGHYAKRKYLEQLVDDPAKDIVYYRFRERNAVKKTVQRAINSVCRERLQLAGPDCQKKVDFGFLLDASGSIGRKNWPKEPKFVMDVLNRFTPFNLKEGTRAGVIIYNDPKFNDLYIKLNDHDSLEDFKKRLDGFVYQEGRRTAIDQALIKAKDELFVESNGDRPGVQNILVLVTDGEQKPPLENGETLRDYSQPLREAGVITMAVGVAAANDTELEAIAGDSRRVFRADNINKLSEEVDSIASKICKSCDVNVGFVLDSSKTTKNHYDHEKKIVQHLAAKLQIGSPEHASVASVISFSSEAEVNIGFDEYQVNYRGFAREVGFLRNMGGRTNIEKGLLTAESEFKHPRNGFDMDEKLQKVIVVLSDGLENEGSVADTARRLRSEGFHIVAISLGNPNDEVLKAITGDEKYVFDLGHRASQDAFGKEINEIVGGICK